MTSAFWSLPLPKGEMPLQMCLTMNLTQLGDVDYSSEPHQTTRHTKEGLNESHERRNQEEPDDADDVDKTVQTDLTEYRCSRLRRNGNRSPQEKSKCYLQNWSPSKQVAILSRLSLWQASEEGLNFSGGGAAPGVGGSSRSSVSNRAIWCFNGCWVVFTQLREVWVGVLPSRHGDILLALGCRYLPSKETVQELRTSPRPAASELVTSAS